MNRYQAVALLVWILSTTMLIVFLSKGGMETFCFLTHAAISLLLYNIGFIEGSA